MSGKTVLVFVMVPLALAVPVILVKLAVREHDPTVKAELLRPYEVVTAEYYGVRLDEKATPSEVVYVLLRSVKDTFKEGDAPTRAEQLEGVRRCQQIQFAVAGPQSILDSYHKSGIPPVGDSLNQKLILKTVLAWSRVVGFYVDGLNLSSVEASKKWMHETISTPASDKEPATATVRFKAKKNGFETGVLVRLAREKDRWRIVRVLLTPGMLPAVSKVKRVIVPPGSQPATSAPATKAKVERATPTKPVRKPPAAVAPKPKPVVAIRVAKPTPKPKPTASQPASQPTTQKGR